MEVGTNLFATDNGRPAIDTGMLAIDSGVEV
jgi:hypothetical protein